MSTRFAEAITRENIRGYVALIPDIKCVSPKEGDLLNGRDPVEVSRHLKEYGAPALSVVTEPAHFGGSPELLREVVKNTGLPVLRKDFVTHADMLRETAELGAAAVLLICAAADANNLRRLYETALELDLEPLVEVHNAAEMEFAGKLGARLIGINNRDIAILERDDGGPGLTASLAAGAPSGALLISESGILSASEARLAVSAGVHALLVGTALWQARDMEAAFRSLRVERSTACGR